MPYLVFGNYHFPEEGEDDFLNQRQYYFFIIIIQTSDIVLNFFKIQTVDVRQINDPVELARNYIVGQFASDLIAVLPWSVIYPQAIFLRFLKFRKFALYQGYIDEILAELASSFLNNEQIKKLVNAFRLVV